MNSQVPVPVPISVRKDLHRNPLLTFLIILAILLIGFSIFVIYFINLYQNTPKLAEGVLVNHSAAKSYQLSVDQATIVAQFGPPDSFTITFYQEEFDPYYAGEVRDETWRYYTEGTEYDFYNGTLMYTVPIPDPPLNWVALPYRPEQFTAYARLDTILASAGISDYFELPLDKELMTKGTLYYAPGLTFGTVRGRLVYVETIMMAEGGE